MEYPKIELEGKEYPFLMGRGALNAYAFETGNMDIKLIEIDDILLNAPLKHQLILNYFCIKVPCGDIDVEFPYTIDEFIDLIKKKPFLLDRMDKIANNQMPVAKGNVQTVKGKN